MFTAANLASLDDKSIALRNIAPKFWGITSNSIRCWLDHMPPNLGALEPSDTQMHDRTVKSLRAEAEATSMTSDAPGTAQGLPDDEYDAWFRAKVQRALQDPRPSIPHEEAMARVEATIQAIADRRNR
ncbi:type II toxin-antitoxin system RelB family antitoxin [Pseudoxanthomonas mexicana]|uniref:type II toxin-antitoxin system RelB family antitoxin n=2 Tax=Pseudoxanthomonas mexicana TaxID=128785 RepID=UPI003083E782